MIPGGVACPRGMEVLGKSLRKDVDVENLPWKKFQREMIGTGIPTTVNLRNGFKTSRGLLPLGYQKT